MDLIMMRKTLGRLLSYQLYSLIGFLGYFLSFKFTLLALLKSQHLSFQVSMVTAVSSIAEEGSMVTIITREQ